LFLLLAMALWELIIAGNNLLCCFDLKKSVLNYDGVNLNALPAMVLRINFLNFKTKFDIINLKGGENE